MFFFLSWLDCPQRKRAGHEGVLEAKRRLKVAKALGCHSSNFWLEPPASEGTRDEYYRPIFRHDCIYLSCPHLQPSLLCLRRNTLALRRPFPFTGDFWTCPVELTGLDSLHCSPWVLQGLLERSVNILLSESGLLPSPQEVFLASWFPAPQNRKLELTGWKFKSECAWAEAGKMLSWGTLVTRALWPSWKEAGCQWDSNPGYRLLKWLSGKEPSCQCRRCKFDPWVRKIPWRRKWQAIPVFLPGKSHGQRSLVGYNPWGCERVRHYLRTKKQQTQSANNISPSLGYQALRTTNSHCSCDVVTSAAWLQSLVLVQCCLS